MLSLQTQREVSAAIEVADMDRAGRLAEAAIDRGEVHPLLYIFAGSRRQHVGDARGAVALLREAVRLDPGNAAALMATGDALRYTGALAEALRMFDAALAVDPLHVAAWYGRAQVLDSMGNAGDALTSYRRVAELAPDTAPGHAGVAACLAQLGRSAEARAAAERALALAPHDPASLIALARADLADQDADAAIRRLRDLAARRDLPAHDQVVALTLLGDALDGRDATEAAFAAYAEANARFAEIHAGPNAPPHHLRLVEAIDRGVLAADASGFAGPAPAVVGAAARHVFLTGYPRSGTTLVEQVLATAPGVETLEEAPTLAAGEPWLQGDGIARLGTMSAAVVGELRAHYWQSVRNAGVDAEGRTFVDMDPLKALQLPLIARLFPAARIVVMRRDPRDVVWSCFRRSFVYSQATYEFTSLLRAARHYDAVMRLTDTCLARLPIAAFDLRYDDVVGDFDATTQRLCDFVGVPWLPAMRRFERTAAARPVQTRSAEQVRRGLFDGSGQWRRYARQLDPVLPILRPWVEKFGFAP